MDKVDFNVKRATVAEPPSQDSIREGGSPKEPLNLQTAQQFINSLPEEQPDAKHYFRSTHPNFSLITEKGTRFSFGDKVPYWHITEDQEEVEYIRRNFIDSEHSDMKILELDRFSFDASQLIQPEIIPFTEEELKQMQGGDK